MCSSCCTIRPIHPYPGRHHLSSMAPNERVSVPPSPRTRSIVWLQLALPYLSHMLPKGAKTRDLLLDNTDPPFQNPLATLTLRTHEQPSPSRTESSSSSPRIRAMEKRQSEGCPCGSRHEHDEKIVIDLMPYGKATSLHPLISTIKIIAANAS
ncbi:hypothetical protein DL93DRAFT_805927 [Clavulina sp. PMI_390]|nr:hypothetical protein DL93DRAFT_805927 [Clavulina sp. PMI_390]